MLVIKNIKLFKKLINNSLISTTETVSIIISRKFRMNEVNYFADSWLDRCSDKRKDQEWIEKQMKSNETSYILFHIDKPLLQEIPPNEDQQTRPKYTHQISKLKYPQIETFLQKDCILLFLGLEYDKIKKTDDSLAAGASTATAIKSPYAQPEIYDRSKSKAWFAIDTNKCDSDPKNIEKLIENSGLFVDAGYMRFIQLERSEASVLAHARSLFCWHDRNQFCASCGHPTRVDEAGHKRTCLNQSCKCNNKSLNSYVPSNISYPRVDPVVIMLVVNPEKTHFLLGRKKSFPKNLFTCLAGFVEPGESIEDAVKREVHEECGVFTDGIVFHSSQPWPFPSNIMIGCLTYATSTNIVIDNDEIEEARWFSIEEIEQILSNSHPESIMIPPARAIANRLINYWFKNKSKL